MHKQEFYDRPTPIVARDLLGCVLNRRLSADTVLSALITEVEAYTQDDPACHAFRGQTARTRVMFGPPARAYVYFIYGMYHCLNVVTEPEGIPGAVLIRGLASTGLDGPGKICRQWQIDRSHNGVDLLDSTSALWITPRQESFEKSIEGRVQTSPRVGISKAQDRLWRFYVNI